MPRGDTKDRLLEVGKSLFLERGYYHAGIEGIVQEAGVPKGSFYHYFDSKEDFGLQVIGSFAACHDEELDQSLGNRSLPPLDRIHSYFLGAIERVESAECRRGCLIGKLGHELADQNEAFRARLESVFSGWVGRLAGCLEEARVSGAIGESEDVHALAEFWLNSWQGSILRAKTARSTAPLRLFLRMTVERIGHKSCQTAP